MLRNEWQDCNFGIAAINERNACTAEDEVLIIAAADPQGTPVPDLCILLLS